MKNFRVVKEIATGNLFACDNNADVSKEVNLLPLNDSILAEHKVPFEEIDSKFQEIDLDTYPDPMLPVYLAALPLAIGDIKSTIFDILKNPFTIIISSTLGAIALVDKIQVCLPLQYLILWVGGDPKNHKDTISRSTVNFEDLPPNQKFNLTVNVALIIADMYSDGYESCRICEKQNRLCQFCLLAAIFKNTINKIENYNPIG